MTEIERSKNTFRIPPFIPWVSQFALHTWGIHMHAFYFISALAVLILSAGAQEPPLRTPMAKALVSPELLAGNRVTFRCLAPNAKEVKVSGQFG